MLEYLLASKPPSEDAEKIYNIWERDTRVENVLLPVRDGLMLVLKK